MQNNPQEKIVIVGAGMVGRSVMGKEVNDIVIVEQDLFKPEPLKLTAPVILENQRPIKDGKTNRRERRKNGRKNKRK